MKFTTSNGLIILASLIVAAGAYWYFFTDTGNEAPLTAEGTVESPSQTQFRTLVSQLQPISFNTGIFSDVRFNALVDLSTPISPEPSGRPDPFAPLAGGSAK